MINTAESDNEILACFDIMQQLRPHIKQEAFIKTIRLMQKEGYQLCYLCEADSNQVKAVMGFKIAHNLFLGRHLYIEDLITDHSSRSKGYGKQMMDWACTKAETSQCDAIHLDSGVQRHQAHKFYLNNGMDIACYHFIKAINR